jgi:hypothetical protein
LYNPTSSGWTYKIDPQTQSSQSLPDNQLENEKPSAIPNTSYPESKHASHEFKETNKDFTELAPGLTQHKM